MMIHPLADVHTDKIGQGTRVWQFSVVLDGAIIGENCNLCAHTLVEGNVLIGNRVTLKSGVFLWSGLRVEDDVFIGPNATFTNDMLPRSQQYPQQYPLTLIKKGASIGANATILPGVIIGEKAMVGAGAVVTKDVAPYSVVVGNPAKHIRFIDKESSLNV